MGRCGVACSVLAGALLHGCAAIHDAEQIARITPPTLIAELQVRDETIVAGSLVPLRIVLRNTGGSNADDMRIALSSTANLRLVGGRGDTPVWPQDGSLIFDEPITLAPRNFAEWWVVLEPRAEGNATVELIIADAGDGVPLRSRVELNVIGEPPAPNRARARDLRDAAGINPDFDPAGRLAYLRNAALLHDEPEFRAHVYFELADSLRALGRNTDAWFYYEQVRVLSTHLGRALDERWPERLRQLLSKIEQTRVRNIDGIQIASLPGSGVIQGIVASSIDRARIAGATVTLDGDGRASARTNELGEFVLRDVIPDRYLLVIEKPGYAPVTMSVFARVHGALHVGVPLKPEEEAAATVVRSE